LATAKKTEPGIDLTGADADDSKPTEDHEEQKRGRGRPSKASVGRDLKTRIGETIKEASEWAGKAGDDELAQILREDGPKMAAWFAYHAEKRARLAKVLGRLFGEGSAFDFGRAFGRLLRALQTRVGAVVPRPSHEEEEPGEGDLEVLGGDGQPG
jgi:hypothetical protein